jgi:hypothetical protein
MEALTQAFLWRCEHSRCVRARDSTWWLPVLLDDAAPTLPEAIGDSIEHCDEPRWTASVASASSDGAASNAFATFRYDCFLVLASPAFLQRRAADRDKFTLLLQRAIKRGLTASCRAGALGVSGLDSVAGGASGDGSHPHALTYAFPVVLTPRLSQQGVGESTSVPRSKVSVTTTPRTHWLPCIDETLTRGERVSAIQAVLAQCDVELSGAVGVFASWQDIAPVAPVRFGPRLRLSSTSRALTPATDPVATDATVPFTAAGLDVALRKCAAAPGLGGACVVIEGTTAVTPTPLQVSVELRWATPADRAGCLPDAADVCPLLVRTTAVGSAGDSGGWAPCPWHSVCVQGPNTLIVNVPRESSATSVKRHRAEGDSGSPPADASDAQPATTLQVAAASLRFYDALPTAL